MKELTVEILEKIQNWRNEDKKCRSIQMELGSELLAEGVEWKLWVFDAKAMSGMFITDKIMDADWQKLILEEKLESARAEVAKLEKQVFEKSI